MDETTDMQGQIVALRLAVEGLWLSILRMDPAGREQAARLGRENVAAIAQLGAGTAEERALRDRVAHHTEKLWGSIGWQLDQDGRQA